MRFTATAAVTMAGVAAASWSPDMGSHGGWGEHGGPPSNGTWGDSYTTEVVTAFTTYCPGATEITHGGSTYSVTEATTLTITDCPEGCTVTYPVSSAAPATETPYAPVTTSETSAVETSPVAPTPYSSAAPSSPAAPIPVYPTNNGTAAAPAPSGTGSYTSATEGSPIPEQTGNGASSLSAGAAGILAVFGLVAAL